MWSGVAALNAFSFPWRQIWQQGSSKSIHGPQHANHIVKVECNCNVQLWGFLWATTVTVSLTPLPMCSIPRREDVTVWNKQRKTHALSYGIKPWTMVNIFPLESLPLIARKGKSSWLVSAVQLMCNTLLNILKQHFSEGVVHTQSLCLFYNQLTVNYRGLPQRSAYHQPHCWEAWQVEAVKSKELMALHYNCPHQYGHKPHWPSTLWHLSHHHKSKVHHRSSMFPQVGPL